MASVELRSAAGLAYREAMPEDEAGGDPVVLVHGFPESSYMWQGLLPAIASAGRRAIAPDLPGFGDSEPDPPGTWERHIEALERWRAELGILRAVMVVHDWGGLVGLRWACDHAPFASGLVISNTGFFPDGKWHGMARAMRAPGEGEELMAHFNREAFAGMMGSLSPGFDARTTEEYWKGLATEERRRGALELYRSGDFEKLEPYRGRLAALDVPVLCLWGENDEFAPVAGAYRFRKEISHAEVVVIEGAGHFVFADAPEGCATAVTRFLDQLKI